MIKKGNPVVTKMKNTPYETEFQRLNYIRKRRLYTDK